MSNDHRSLRVSESEISQQELDLKNFLNRGLEEQLGSIPEAEWDSVKEALIGKIASFPGHLNCVLRELKFTLDRLIAKKAGAEINERPSDRFFDTYFEDIARVFLRRVSANISQNGNFLVLDDFHGERARRGVLGDFHEDSSALYIQQQGQLLRAQRARTREVSYDSFGAGSSVGGSTPDENHQVKAYLIGFFRALLHYTEALDREVFPCVIRNGGHTISPEIKKRGIDSIRRDIARVLDFPMDNKRSLFKLY